MNSLNWYRLLWLFCFSIIQFANAQVAASELSFVDLQQGITQKAISNIVQDQNGLIWIAAYGGGLYKYYGSDIISYRQKFNDPKSLNSSLVQTSLIDSKNRLWAGTEVGLDMYNEDYDNFDHVEFHNENDINLDQVIVLALEETDSGTVLIGTYLNGLFEVNPQELIARPVEIVASSPETFQVRCLKKRSDGKIVIGTNQGLYEYDGNSVKPITLKGAQFANRASYGIESIIIDDSGSIWMGTYSSGLLKVSSASINTYQAERFPITDEQILTMVQGPDGKILCGTENDGLLAVEKDGSVSKHYQYDKFAANGLKSNSIWTLFVDNQKRVWIGYYNAGVGVSDILYDKFKDLESVSNIHNSLRSSSVTSIVKDKKNRLWIGMDGGGIDVYDLEEKTFVHLIDQDNPIAKGFEALDVQNLFIDSGSNLWVATWNSGIYYLPKGSNLFKHFEVQEVNGRLRFHRIMNFAEDIDGVVWIGTSSSGLHYYDSKAKKFDFVADSLFRQGAEIRKVLVDRNNTVWVATNRGVFKRENGSNGAFENLELMPSSEQNPAEKVLIDLTVTLFEDKFGNIWIGTDGAGLWKYDVNGKNITWFNSASTNLEQESIATILEGDDGNLWLGGNKGLSYFEIEKQQFTNYSANDGLLSDDFNYNAGFKDEDGTMYFGNYKGVNVVNPETITFNERRPKVYFTNFKIHNKSSRLSDASSPLKKAIGKTEHLTLNHNQSFFTIEFAALNYTRPEKNKYAYYLEGLEDTWNFVSNTTSATYTNLSPGDYTFMVKAANNDGVWNESAKTLQLTVLPPWYRTNLAIACYLILFVMISVFAFRLTKERIREKRLIQVERARRLQEEELNNRKIQFFTNISHEFRTPLTLILNPLESVMHDQKYRLSKGLSEKLNIIHKNTARLKRLIDELMDFRKLQLNKFSIKVSEIDVVDFSQEIAEHFNEEAELKNIAMLFESSGKNVKLWSDPGMLEKVLFNILSNAFKITPDNGTITIGVHQKEVDMIFPLIDTEKKLPAIEIFIEDTGSGISQEEVRNVFERFYQVKNMNSQYYGGTGIGLEVVKSFVDLLKGHIVVESEETVGTKFRVFLPMGREHFNTEEFLLGATINEEQVPAANQDIPETARLEILTGAKKTLLIVEDNTELRSYLKNELQSEYNVFEAANGQQGLNMAVERIPDLIITDVVMPEMNGFEFCEAIKADLKTSHIPLLMLTAKTMSEDWIKGIDSGADIYLSKPFDLKVLRAQLRRIVKSRQILFDKFGEGANNVKIPENTSLLDKGFITKVMEYIIDNIADENLNVEQLAEELNLSRSQLYRKIKSLTGHTANEFLRKLRLEKAKEIIENGDASISEVCYKVGFSSPSYFTKCFKAYFGVLPTEFKQE